MTDFSLSGSSGDPTRDRSSIYDQYTARYNDINAKIHEIDSLPYEQRIKPEIVSSRNNLLKLQSELTPKYQEAYGVLTLGAFLSHIQPILDAVTSTYNQAMGISQSSEHDQIDMITKQVKTQLNQLNDVLSKNTSALATFKNNYASLQTQIASLKAQATGAPSNGIVSADLSQAEKDRDAFKANLDSLDLAIKNLTADQSQMSAVALMLDELDAIITPSQDDVSKASGFLDQLQTIKDHIAAVNTVLSLVPKNQSAVEEDIKKIQQDLTSATPSSTVDYTPYRAEIYSTYLDYYDRLNNQIYGINQLPPDIRTLTAVEGDRLQIVAIQQQIGALFQKAYGAATLTEFEDRCASLLLQAENAYNAALQGAATPTAETNANHDQIVSITSKMNSAMRVLNTSILSYEGTIQDIQSAFTSVQNQIASLQPQVDALAGGTAKDKALEDLHLLKGDAQKLSTSIDLLTSDLDVLSKDQVTMQSSLNQLTGYSNLVNPSTEDVAKANELFSIVQTIAAHQSTLNNDLSIGKEQRSASTADVAQVKQDISAATTPSPSEDYSKDRDAIYDAYLAEYQDINTKIHEIDLLPGERRTLASVADDRTALISLREDLGILFQKSYGVVGLQDYLTAIYPIMQQVNAAYTDATGLNPTPVSPNHAQIDTLLSEAQRLTTAWEGTLSQGGANVSLLVAYSSSLKDQIATLESQIAALPDGDQKTIAADALTQLHGTAKTFDTDVTGLQTIWSKLQNDDITFSTAYKQIVNLDKLEEPSNADVSTAEAFLLQLQTFSSEPTTFNAALSAATNDKQLAVNALNATKTALTTDPSITIIKQDLNQATTIIARINKTTASDQAALNTASSQLAALGAKLEALQQDPNSSTIDLSQAQSLYDALQKQIIAAQNLNASYETQAATAQASFSTLQELKALTSPSQTDRAKADAALVTIKNVDEAHTSIVVPTNDEFTALRAAISTASNQLHPGSANPASDQTMYFDVGTTGTYIWQFIDGGSFNAEKYIAYMRSKFADMQGAGMGQVDLSFAQLDTLDMYISNEFRPQSNFNDSIAYNMYDLTQKNGVNFPPGENLLTYIMEAAKSLDPPMKVGLAFGGVAAHATPDWEFDRLGSTPQEAAHSVANMMLQYGIDTVDFDDETATTVPQNRALFFKSLHDELSGTGRTMTLTITADPSITNTYFKNIFYADPNEPTKQTFSQYFDGLNIMAYSNGGPNGYYYIQPKQMELFIDAVGKENVGMVHLGFEDDLDYSSSSTNFWTTGYGAPFFPFPITPGSTPGQAAAQLYLSLLNKLEADGYVNNSKGLALGKPFWWPEENDSTTATRYAPGTSFWMPVTVGAAPRNTVQEIDFYNTLNGMTTPSTPTPTSAYTWQEYRDYWSPSGVIPSTTTENYAFAVVNGDGTFDLSEYPINPTSSDKSVSLAIGGWNNSQSTKPMWGPNGFYQIVESFDPSQTIDATHNTKINTFINSIATMLQAYPNAWNGVTLDFENYDRNPYDQTQPRLDPSKYTGVVLAVRNMLTTKFPDASLQVAISPNPHNREYFDIKTLASANITFQLMNYDYALGQTLQPDGQILVLPNAPVFGPTIPGVGTMQYDLNYLINIEQIPPEQVTVGLQQYGVIYQCQPNLTAEEVTTALDASSMKAANSVQQITNDAILGKIGSWDTPNTGWLKITDQWGNQYYYSPGSGQMIASTKPSEYAAQVASLIKDNYPTVKGFFGWEAIGDQTNILQKTDVLTSLQTDLQG